MNEEHQEERPGRYVARSLERATASDEPRVNAWQRSWRRVMWRREMNGDRELVRFARAVFWLSSQLSVIKTPQRTFTLDVERWLGDPDLDIDDVSSRGPRIMLTNRFSVKLMSVAMHLAWDHWDHFALNHEDHVEECTPCPHRGCGGLVHPRHDELDD